MLRKEEILEIIRDWNYWDKDVESGIFHRAGYVEKIVSLMETKEVVVLKGVRRSGKSTLLKLLVLDLHRRGISRDRILIVNFEDSRFYPYLELNLLEKIFETYRTFVNQKEKCFVFLDEVHYVPMWEKWVGRYRDLYPHEVKIIVTGSSSKLLDSEYATALTGRTLSVTVFPLSFKEYVGFKGVHVGADLLSIISKKREIVALLKDYIENGGFPEFLSVKQKRLLGEYLDGILYKDILERYRVRDAKTIKQIAFYLLTNISKEYTYNSLRKTFKVSLDLVRRYVGYIESAYLVFSVNMFSYSLKEQEVNPRKIYCIDTGLRNVIGFKFSEDYGRLYENLVFLELKRRIGDLLMEIYYWRNGKREVDFVVKEGLKPTELIQVCWDIEDPNTKKRELTGLLEGMRKFKLNQGLVITEDLEGEETFEDKKIRFIPLWKWLLRE